MTAPDHSDPRTIGKLRETWETLGKDDPLWAVVSHADKRGGRWQLDDFLATGEADVARVCELLARSEAGPPFRHVLDFGCGVGRLSRAWAARSRLVTGVDISVSMLSKATAISNDRPNIRFEHNDRDDLRLFPDETFDVVSSLICLQHMPWAVAAGYLSEFARVCESGGLVVFQLPTRRHLPSSGGKLRRVLVDSLPFGLGAAYRRWRYGTAAVFDMHFTPCEAVEKQCRSAGLTPVLREPDMSAGAGTEGFLYVFRKLAAK
jgi:ubiquinone/menaquinone biosynthesis C-methylase UbiE